MASAEKSLLKKQTILNAAIDVVYEDKISGANLRKIAKAAGMSQGNLHYYYPSKESLYIDLLDHILHEFLDEERDVLFEKSVDPKKKLAFILEQDKAYILRKKKMLVIMDFIVNGTKNDQLHDKIREIYNQWRSDVQGAIKQGVESGAFKSKYKNIMPALTVAIMDGAALQHLIYGDDFDLDKFYDSIRKMLLDMLV